MALDENLAALLTEDVQYQRRIGVDKNGQPTWATAVTLKCYAAYGARAVQKSDGTTYTSTQALWFDANDAVVKQFKLGDRFTAIGIGGGQTVEAVTIEPMYSPGPGLNEPTTAWIVEVSL